MSHLIDRFKKMNPRKMIRMWCEKELFNLKLLLKAGIPCPEPVCIKKHILFMRFIGDKGILILHYNIVL